MFRPRVAQPVTMLGIITSTIIYPYINYHFHDQFQDSPACDVVMLCIITSTVIYPYINHHLHNQFQESSACSNAGYNHHDHLPVHQSPPSGSVPGKSSLWKCWSEPARSFTRTPSNTSLFSMNIQPVAVLGTTSMSIYPYI